MGDAVITTAHIDLLFYRSKGPVAALIRLQTRSRYAHVAIRYMDGTIYEARSWHGVREIIDPGKPDLILRINMTNWCEANSQLYARTQVGKGYDYLGVFRFISRRRHGRRQSPCSRLFCSEFAFACLQRVGIPPLHRTEAWEVSPGMLARTPIGHVHCDEDETTIKVA